MQYALFDIHSHLNFPQFDSDREEVVAHLKKNGIGTITVGTGEKTSREAVALASLHDHLFATVGVHPTDAKESFDEKVFTELVGDPNVVAVGECGLDYYRNSEEETKVRQKELFLQHISFAQKHNKPLMIHGRPSGKSMDAYEDILALLSASAFQLEGKHKNGNVHFFVGSTDIAKRFLDLGFTISFDGPITFVSDYDDAVRYVPGDCIMAETDSPFAAPEPFRGKRCDPSMVANVARRIALIRGEEYPKMAETLVTNAVRTFSLPVSFET